MLIGLIASCGSPRQPIRVGVEFTNTWTIRGETLTESEVSAIKERTLDTLTRAYSGFNIVFSEARGGARTIRVEDTPYAVEPRERISFGAAGVTYPVSTTSSVRFDVLSNLVLTVAHCERLAGCEAARSDVMQGLGTGIGATAAHELGHQAGFEFSTDSDCADCYDGRMSASRAHFFGENHWSPGALQAMKRVLPAT